MNKATKVIVIIGFLIVFFLVFGLIVGIKKSSGHDTPGILGLIVFIGFIAGIRAIWKYNSTNQDKEPIKKDKDDVHQLDKS
jgi:protein-S-isoprenylcysteine O-methyltransferase Ste14